MKAFPRGIQFALLAMMCFAVQDGVSKYLAQHYPVPFFVMLRYWVFAAFALTIAARAPGGARASIRTTRPALQILRGLLLVVQILVFVTALDLLGMAAMMSLFAVYPLLITLLAIPILGERVGWRRFLAVGIGFLGVLVILRPGMEVFDPNALVGLLAALGIAAYSIMTRIATRADEGSGAAIFYTAVTGCLLISVIGPFYWVPMSTVDWGWAGLLALAGLAGHSLLIKAYEQSEAARIQPFAYLQMVFGVLIGWTIFAEPIDPWMILGMTMIVCAGLYALWRETRVSR